MKYRRLSQEELAEMETEFVQFLISNGIDAPDWVRIKDKTPAEAEAWIDAFSDVVIQKVLTSIKYLEMRTSHEVRLFECGEDGMNAIFMRSQEVDLLDAEALKLAVTNPGKLELYKASKNYSKPRELELFEMTQSGCEIADGKLYLLLKQML